MSGNNIRILLGLLLLFVTSAHAQSERKLYDSRNKDVLRFESDTIVNSKEKEKSVEPVPPVEKQNEALKEENKIHRKEVYKVALILPFNYELAWSKMNRALSSANDSIKQDYEVPRESQISIEFYRGLQLAAKELTDSSAHIELSVYDDKKSETEIRDILAKPELKSMDLIIGPVYNQNAKIVADFCKENKIYNFCPISPSRFITSSNPYHFKLNPTIEMHMKSMVNLLDTRYHGGKVIVMLRNNDDEKALASMLWDYVKSVNNYRPDSNRIQIDTVVAGSELSKKSIAELILPGKQNFFIAPSFNESFASDMGKKFASNTLENVTLFGMPTWLDYEAVKIDYQSRAKTHFTQVVYADSSLEEVKKFNSEFYDEYRYHPTENNYLGFDVMNFAAYALKNFGLSLKEHFDELNYSGIATRFSFQPSKYIKSDNKLNFDLFENSKVHFLMIEDFELKEQY